jgi:hypothetical protein
MEYVININGASIELQEAIPEGFPNRGYVWHGPLMNFG